MKDNHQIEDLFRKSFNDHEYDYDAAQWDSLSKRLNKSKSSNNWKWFYGSAALLFVTAIVLSVLYYNSDDGKSAESNHKTPNDNTNKPPHLVASSDSTFNTNESKDSSKSNNNQGEKREKSLSDLSAQENGKLKSKKELKQTNSKKHIETKENQSAGQKSIDKKEAKNVVDDKSLIDNKDLGNFITSFNDKCLNETISIHNKNKDHLYVVFPNGATEEIAPDEKYSFKLRIPGMHRIQTRNRHDDLENSFAVSELPEISLHHSAELNFESGLPVLHCEVSCQEKKIHWELNNHNVENSENISQNNLLIFSRGNNNITVRTKNEFGCSNESSSSILIEKDYNLLAVNAFSPNSLDPRNQTFMPYALVIRNTPFTLSIYDPDDGGIVFETEDPNFPWEGIDKRTGSLIPLNKAYIWRVNMKQPAKGESPIYQGTLVRF